MLAEVLADWRTPNPLAPQIAGRHWLGLANRVVFCGPGTFGDCCDGCRGLQPSRSLATSIGTKASREPNSSMMLAAQHWNVRPGPHRSVFTQT